MKPKHTPGPWRKQGNIIWGKEIQSKVCQIYTQHIPALKSGAEEESANVNLIVMGPEMLEALGLAERALENVTNENFKAQALAYIRKVIAKVAEGGSK